MCVCLCVQLPICSVSRIHRPHCGRLHDLGFTGIDRLELLGQENQVAAQLQTPGWKLAEA